MITNRSAVTFLPFSICNFFPKWIEKWLPKIVITILITHHHTDWKLSPKPGIPAPKILNIQ